MNVAYQSRYTVEENHAAPHPRGNAILLTLYLLPVELVFALMFLVLLPSIKNR